MPEAEGREDLFGILQGLFCLMLDHWEGEATTVKLDRATRVMRPRTLDPTIQRDIVCKIHHYPVKDLLSQKTWDHGPYDL